MPAAAWVPLSLSPIRPPGLVALGGSEAAGSALPRNSTELLLLLLEKERSPWRFLNCIPFQVFRSL